mmetsp:Transcript_5287/g.15170  ORF Transcript_5287/g.15170 Transcript_5287/m.15170 type:complete len:333 (-) Transcript_5287:452-1450(-)
MWLTPLSASHNVHKRVLRTSLCHLEALDLLEDGLGPLILLEVVPDGLQDDVDCLRQRRLQVTWVQSSRCVVRLELCIAGVRLLAVLAVDGELAKPREDDHADVRETRVPLHSAGGAEGLFDFGLDLGGAVLHEDSRGGVALRHLLLPLQKAGHHGVRQDDGLEPDLGLCRVAVLPRQHVHLPLVHPQLADVRLQEEDVCALHAGVEDLRRRHLALAGPPHDLAAACNTLHGVAPRHVHHQWPILCSSTVDLLRGGQELHRACVVILDAFHAHSLPDLHHVLSHRLDLLQVAPHLVVQLREVVCHPELEGNPTACQLIHIQRLQHALSNVHAA